MNDSSPVVSSFSLLPRSGFRLHSLARAGLAFAAFLVAAAAEAAPVINEIMASNRATLRDDDGDYSDWIELRNPDSAPVDLNGWYLTDKTTKPKKWKFPAVTIPAGGYLVVFASGKDRTDAAKPLHLSFKLSADGDYLGLIRPDGATPASEFSPAFPAQYTDISYGRTEPVDAGEAVQVGYFSAPTPGARNGTAADLTLGEQVTFSRGNTTFVGELEVTLGGAQAGQKIRYVMAAPSGVGAIVADPTAASPEYTGPLAVTGSVIIRAAVFSADDSRHGTAASAHFLRVDDTSPAGLGTFSSRLPVLVLDNHGYGPLIKDDVDHPAFLYAFLPGTEGTTDLLGAPAQESAALMTVRGSTSSGFPKKSYKFSLIDAGGRGAAQPLLELGSFEEWNLIGPWGYDRSYIRNAVAYALSNRMGRWAPRTRLAEVYFNNNGGPLDRTDYAGVYLLADKLEEAPDRVAITKLSAADTTGDALTGGYILRVDSADPEKYSWHTARGFPDVEAAVLMVESPKADKLPQVQRDYIRGYVQAAEDALYSDQASGWKTHAYLDYFDRASWVDHHLLNTFLKNTDAFWRSTYFTKDRRGKLVAGPVWDFDRCMNSADPRDDEYDTWNPKRYTDQGFAVPYWETGWWGVLAQDPDFMQAWVDRWQSLRQGVLADGPLAQVVDGLAEEVGQEAAERDSARWPDNVSEHGSFGAETAQLRNWLVHRAQWIDTQFTAPPAAGAQGQLLRVIAPKGSKLAYTLDGTDPRLPGGGLSASAQLADHEVYFTDASGARVRSYRADQAPVFPGSPWSRLVIPSTDHGSAGEDPLPEMSQEISADLGQSVTLGLNGPVNGAVSYVWKLNDVAIAGATTGQLDFPRLNDTHNGTYTLIVSGPGGVLTTVSYVVNVSADLHLVNLSSRSRVGTGGEVLIDGFVTEGAAPKRYLVRAVGPALAHYGVGQPLVAPTLKIFDQAGNLLATNTGWETGPNPAQVAAAAEQAGAFALTAGQKDSALLLELPKGVYSMHVSGVDGGVGVGLGEIYALDESGSPINLSARARVRPGEDSLIGGFVVTGTNPRRMLIRAVGPSLTGYGVADALADPVLQIVQRTTVLYQNDDWGQGPDAAAVRTTAATVGAFPLLEGGKDAALVVDLPPGVYSIVVRSKGDATGVAMAEIYAVK